MLIAILAAWLVALSALLRFFAVSSGPRCRVCEGPLELWPDRRHCADCDLVFVEPRTLGSRARSAGGRVH